MLISHIEMFRSADDGTLERKRRAARKAFKAATDGKGGFRLWTLLCPQRTWSQQTNQYTKTTSFIRLIVRVEKYGGGMRCEHTVRGWIYPNGTRYSGQTPSGMTDLYEESKITAHGDRSQADWSIKPDLEELRGYARIVIDTLGSDPIAELKSAALASKAKEKEKAKA